MNVKGVTRFEANFVPHHHLICRKCGKIEDFESDELFDYLMKVAGGIEGFNIDSVNTNFYGECKDCKEKNRNG